MEYLIGLLLALAVAGLAAPYGFQGAGRVG
jgi:hypothetical protein